MYILFTLIISNNIPQMCSCIRSSIIYLLVLTHNPISRVQQYKAITSIRCFNINIYSYQSCLHHIYWAVLPIWTRHRAAMPVSTGSNYSSQC